MTATRTIRLTLRNPIPAIAAALLLGLSLVVVAAAPALSAVTPSPGAAVSQVQLSAFMAPIRQADGRGGAAAVTPLLSLADGVQIDEICWLSPRIMDAFMTTLHRHPIKFRKSVQIQTEDLKKRLTDAANRALGRTMIGDVELVGGIKPARNGSARFYRSAKCGQSKGR